MDQLTFCSNPSCLLEAGIFTSHIIWLVRTRQIRKDAKAQGKTFDDIAAEHESRGTPFKFAERKSRKEKKRVAKENTDSEAGLGDLGPLGKQTPLDNTTALGETSSDNGAVVPSEGTEVR